MKNNKSITGTFFTAGSCAITRIPNGCMVKIWSFFALIKISANYFIENQSEWERVQFGVSTKDYSGCEIMAVYNALLDLGNEMTAQSMAEMNSEFERKGAATSGKWGCAPRAIYKYLVCWGYRVTMTTCSDTDTINAIGENSDSVIITAYNDRNDIRKMIHITE